MRVTVTFTLNEGDLELIASHMNKPATKQVAAEWIKGCVEIELDNLPEDDDGSGTTHNKK